MSRSPTGTPVIMLPGTLAPASIYRHVTAELDVPARALDWILDVPECTVETVAAHVAAVIDDAGGPAVLVGHSTGATIAAVVALDHPEAVAGLVLINSGPNMTGHGAVRQMLSRMRAQESDAMWTDFARANVPAGSPEEWIEEMVAFSRRVGVEPAASILASQAATDLLGRRQTRNIPVEVLHGLLDAKRQPGDGQKWLQIFPRAAFTAIENCGHTPPLEAPLLVAQAIRRVLAAASPGETMPETVPK